ncbi:MAG: hypothetical protein KGO53_01755 [Alphaproteobacteria bacterium]|nr:hypothetical protein [Alphaproteobacteria bacterium]
MSRHRILLQRTTRNSLWALAVIAVAMVIGMCMYVYFGNGEITWASAFDDAAMILASEGPRDQLKTAAGQWVEGVYALVCGFLFFAIAGFALAPALHHVLRSFHLEDEERAARQKK